MNDRMTSSLIQRSQIWLSWINIRTPILSAKCHKKELWTPLKHSRSKSKSKTFSDWCPFQMPIQWHQSHADLIWLDGTVRSKIYCNAGLKKMKHHLNNHKRRYLGYKVSHTIKAVSDKCTSLNCRKSATKSRFQVLIGGYWLDILQYSPPLLIPLMTDNI